MKYFKIKNLTLFIFIIFFNLWSNPNLTPHENGDSPGYVSLANNFSDEKANDLRSFGYPLLIKFSMILDFDNWKKVLVLTQIFLHAFSMFILYLGLIKINYNENLALLLSLIIGIHPALIVYTNYLIAESFMGFVLILYWFIGISIIKTKFSSLNIFFLGFISSFAYMVKAVWILGFTTFIFPLMYLVKNKKKIILPLILLTFAHFSLPIFWESFKAKTNTNNEKFRYQSIVVNINMAAVRIGLIESAKGTDLYKKIDSLGYMDLAKQCNGKDDGRFRTIYHSIDFMDRYDLEFTKDILENSLLEFTCGQLINIYRIFSDRTHLPGYDAFKYMPHKLKYLYFSIYNFFYRPLLFLLLIFGVFLNFKNTGQRGMIIFNYSILVYFSLVLSLFTIAPVHMIRMRIPIEFLIVIHSISPVINYFRELDFLSDNKIFKYF